SWLGYLLFGLILYACNKRRVFVSRIHDVLLILIFAFLTDLLKMRVLLLLIFSEYSKQEHGYWILPTTISACTLGVWIFYSHFLITYVQAV
ncbi:hypothetical protein PENTCL1PPCAC_21612, partial [Pristionchus entomophagus]